MGHGVESWAIGLEELEVCLTPLIYKKRVNSLQV